MKDDGSTGPYRYPESRKTDHIDVIHGVKVPDPYRWLEEIDSEETRAWIDAQNELTFGYLGNIGARERIRRRMTELWDYEKFDVPHKEGGVYLFTRNDGLQNQSVLYCMGSLEDEPRALIDPNPLSEDGTIALTGTAVSDDGRLIAYGLSASGSDWQDWRIRDIETGVDLDDHLKWIKFAAAQWTPDDLGFFYSRYEEPEPGKAYKEANFNQKICYHRVGSPQSEDEIVYERPDEPEWRFRSIVTDDKRFHLLSVNKGTARENGIFIRELGSGEKGFTELLNEFDAIYTFIGNEGDTFYFRTDLDAPMGRVISVDLNAPERENWREVVEETSDSLSAVSLVGGMFVATYIHDAYSQVKVYSMDGGYVRDVELPGLGNVMGFEGEHGDPETFYMFMSHLDPGAVYRYDVETDETTVFRRPKLGYDPEDYTTEQVFYASKDGTRVPMFVSYRKGLERDGRNPAYLTGYGGFNIPSMPRFSVRNLLWMEMGGVYAQANLRGGGEYGKEWHEAGTKLRKQNVFDDFIAAAEWLIENGYTDTPHLAISGRSNGGLLAGACLVQRPDLYGVVLPIVGVLDMLRFEKFTVGRGWVSDYGSVDDPDEFRALLAYSPYHNAVPGTEYPPTLITTGDHDDRVFPAHSFKFAAAMQAAHAGSAPVLIRIDTKAGHGGGKPSAKLIEEYTDELAFIVENLGVEC